MVGSSLVSIWSRVKVARRRIFSAVFMFPILATLRTLRKLNVALTQDVSSWRLDRGGLSVLGRGFVFGRSPIRWFRWRAGLGGRLAHTGFAAIERAAA